MSFPVYFDTSGRFRTTRRMTYTRLQVNLKPFRKTY